jgi:hypothetical protein
MSVAPEIARLAEAVALGPAGPQTQPQAPPETPPQAQPKAQPVDAERHQDPSGPQLTLGTLARRLRTIAATPERWWGLVSFEPDRSVQITVEECAAYRAWLVVLPPGDAGRTCDCDVATMIAGEATEGAPASPVLRPGPVRVHGGRHGLRGRGTGYSVSLHAQAR